MTVFFLDPILCLNLLLNRTISLNISVIVLGTSSSDATRDKKKGLILLSRAKITVFRIQFELNTEFILLHIQISKVTHFFNAPLYITNDHHIVFTSRGGSVLRGKGPK